MIKTKPRITEVVKRTPGGSHSWVKARVGAKEIVIRKENKNVNINITSIRPEIQEKINKHLKGSWWKRLLKCLKIIK